MIDGFIHKRYMLVKDIFFVGNPDNMTIIIFTFHVIFAKYKQLS